MIMFLPMQASERGGEESGFFGVARVSPQRLAHRALQHGVHLRDASLDRLVQRLEPELDQTANAHLRRDQVRLEPVRRVYHFPHAFRVVKRLEVHRV